VPRTNASPSDLGAQPYPGRPRLRRRLGIGAVTPREVERLQDLHDLLVSLHRQTLAAGIRS